ncbi:MAG: prolyl oligopeptidase family serine peptidase, partial [Planctomycetaceae bacterium]|nr:prolyl oligopeptidase family serine peptidase [Planctomycetaceae bacterium]
PDKLGVMGWSNGGFLTNAIITKDSRFKAASSGAGVIDQVLQWGLEDTPGHVINYMNGKLPWENPALYQKSSPLYDLGKVTAATLIHVGEKDARVPAAHAKTLFRGLSRYGKAPTQLITYPGAGHSPTTYAHRKAKMAWDVAWFQHYLLGDSKEPKKPNILAPSPKH